MRSLEKRLSHIESSIKVGSKNQPAYVAAISRDGVKVTHSDHDDIHLSSEQELEKWAEKNNINMSDRRQIFVVQIIDVDRNGEPL